MNRKAIERRALQYEQRIARNYREIVMSSTRYAAQDWKAGYEAAQRDARRATRRPACLNIANVTGTIEPGMGITGAGLPEGCTVQWPDFL